MDARPVHKMLVTPIIMKQQDQNTEPSRDSSLKLAYAVPEITAYGRVADLTAGTTSKTNDSGGSQNGKSSRA